MFLLGLKLWPLLFVRNSAKKAQNLFKIEGCVAVDFRL